MIQDIFRADKEISYLFSSVQREPDAIKTGEARKHFKENPEFFKILEFDDIKKVDFGYDSNAIRNTKRKIFSNIVKNAGKKVAGYKIVQELGLKSG